MDELIDFEELIDVNHYLGPITDEIQKVSQERSPEPIADALDKMCEGLAGSSLDIDNILGDHDVIGDMIADDTVIDLDEFESILAKTCPCNYCTKNMETINSKVNKDSTNTKQIEEEDINIVTYEVPIIFEDISDASKNVSHDLDRADDKLASFIDYTVERESNEIKEITNLFNLETIDKDKLKTSNEVDIQPETRNLEDKKVNVTSNEDYELYSDDGYNSSDFEFISENEATKEGVTKIDKNTNASYNYNNVVKYHSNIQAVKNTDSYPANPDDNRPTTSNSRKNEASYYVYAKYSKYRYQSCYAHTSTDFHIIPEGEQYLDMFRGEFSPVIINNLHTLTNKSVLPTKTMAAKFDDLGFKVLETFDENDEYKEEAEECSRQIISSYPAENRRKRRRF